MDSHASDPTDAGSERRRLLGVAGVLVVAAGLAAIDLVGDLGEGTTLRHALIEGAIVLAGVVGLGLLARRLGELARSEAEAREAAAGLARDLARSREEAERWRAEAAELLAGLGELIERQFGRWSLSPAEREVARLLLKGLGHKQIARLRGVSEATTRQQATAVYRKAGVGGRSDLAAFFLEDLLAP